MQAWYPAGIKTDKFQIVRMESELIGPAPIIQLLGR
jgi:hypothetical protein